MPIKQCVTSDDCLQCQGCCRFLRPDSVWSPGLLEEDITNILQHGISASCVTADKRIKLIWNPSGSNFLCSFLNKDGHTCAIYAFRPLECRLYPFLINRRREKVFLSVDMHCPLAAKKMQAEPLSEREAWEKYIEYLADLLQRHPYNDMLKNNPHIVQTYQEANDLKELSL